jgi:hypothetical protein
MPVEGKGAAVGTGYLIWAGGVGPAHGPQAVAAHVAVVGVRVAGGAALVREGLQAGVMVLMVVWW